MCRMDIEDKQELFFVWFVVLNLKELEAMCSIQNGFHRIVVDVFC